MSDPRDEEQCLIGTASRTVGSTEQPICDPASKERLKRLRAMTETLPSFPTTTGPAVEGFKQHEMECGTSLSWNLLSQDEISCARWFNSAGTKFPLHAHEQREWVIVYSGSMFLRIEGQKERRLLPGMSVVVEPNISHQARFVEDCWYLAIAIPHAPEWPE